MDDLWVVLPHLGAGGAQKVGLLAAGHFAAQGFSVRVVTLKHGHPLLHQLPEGVVHEEVGHPDTLLHPWLRDGWNRSLLARARRFSIAQVIKAYLLLIRGELLLLRPWLEPRIQPGAKGPAPSLFRYSTNALGGQLLKQLRARLERDRPRRLLALLTRTNILCCCAAWDLPIHLVVSERNDPRRQHLDRLWSFLRRVCYRRADVVTANTAGVLDALAAMGTWRRLELLPNPLPARTLAPAARNPGQPEASRRPLLLAVARLVPQKGLDLLISAFARLDPEQRHSWRVVIAGDGPERRSLEALAAREKVADQVEFLGFQDDPGAWMAQASVFVLPSRFEGMPNALLEAMAHGLPAVVSDVSPGPLEVVEDGNQGLVVPGGDVKALQMALARLITDRDLRLRMGAAARERLRALDWPVVEPLWRSVLQLPEASPSPS